MKILKLSFLFLSFSYLLSYLRLGYPTQSLKLVSFTLLFISFIFVYRNKLKKPTIWQASFFVIFNVLGVITSLLSDRTNTSFFTLVQLNMFFVLFIFIKREFKKSSSLITFNKLLILSSFIVTSFAFISSIPLVLSQINSYFYGRIRVYGLYDHPNFLGAVCFVTIMAALVNIIINRKITKGYVFTILVFTGFLILSDSRGAMYSLFVFAFCYIAFKWFNKLKAMLLKIVFLILFIPLIALITSWSTKDINDETLHGFSSGRVTNWEYIYNNFITSDTQSFLFGHGFSSVDLLVHLKINTDNGFVVWFFEAGLLNLILISLLVFIFFIRNVNHLKINVLVLSLLISYLMYANVENFLMNFGHVVPLFCWAIIYSQTEPNKVEYKKTV